tara:strand:- start:4048 stop:4452 length:405 start_codon:yes stop_codon:yes gene_type:complete
MIKKISQIGESFILVVIGFGALLAALSEIARAAVTYNLQIDNLFTLFIYAEIIGMVGAYTSSSRIPVTLPIIIAITALCRLIVMHSKEMDALILLSESISILVLGVAAYVLSLKGKLSFEKERMVELANEERNS